MRRRNFIEVLLAAPTLLLNKWSHVDGVNAVTSKIQYQYALVQTDESGQTQTIFNSLCEAYESCRSGDTIYQIKVENGNES